MAEPATRTRDDLRSVTGLVTLMFVMWGGLVAWGVRITVAHAMVGFACRHDATWALHVVNTLTALVALAAVLAGVKVLRAAKGSDAGDWTVHGREAFMALAGVLLSGLGLWLILFESSTIFFIDPCA